LGGKSGVFKHVSDFDDIIRPENGTNEFESYVKEDIVGIVASMNRVFKNEYPLQINDTSDIANKPEFYFITLDNNPQTPKHSTPKMTMGGYVFNKDNPKYISLGTKRQAKVTVESGFGDITDHSNKLYAQFLFSKDTVDKISITDIIDDTSYDREF
jgi:hypothetical protein